MILSDMRSGLFGFIIDADFCDCYCCLIFLTSFRLRFLVKILGLTIFEEIGFFAFSSWTIYFSNERTSASFNCVDFFTYSLNNSNETSFTLLWYMRRRSCTAYYSIGACGGVMSGIGSITINPLYCTRLANTSSVGFSIVAVY